MHPKLKKRFLQVIAILALGLVHCCPSALAQQTLGGIAGTVTDSSGSSVPSSTVTAVQDATQLTRIAMTNESGDYSFVNLPIGTYTLTYTHDGFERAQGFIVMAGLKLEAVGLAGSPT